MAEAFKDRLIELGPAYIKLGQVLSTRPDPLPATYVKQLENLQDGVPAMEFSEVEECIAEELGAPVNKLFGTFDRQPLGSASLGQVHAATLRDGREVVVKVQRPGIREILSEDMEFFHELAGFLAAHTSAGDKVDIIGVVQQLERALVDELDYRTEARNAASFRRSLVGFPHILARNDFAFRVDTPQLPMLLNGMEKIANRIFTGLVLAGLLIAGSSMLQYWRTLGVICIAIAAGLGLWMIANVLINDRKKDGG